MRGSRPQRVPNLVDRGRRGGLLGADRTVSDFHSKELGATTESSLAMRTAAGFIVLKTLDESAGTLAHIYEFTVEAARAKYCWQAVYVDH